ncbi:LuxR C-terminal-related transcriptional regulator [Streptomyces sp. NPDC003077]|uniref:LuxR family transcriptional regulator n=1 Tax=Streptomyces sp. NPDC003077 TaxID=3154443 RepID=UPI0033B027A3
MSVDLPLRGREPEIARVRAVLEYVRRGGSSLLVLNGPPGVGKTRLLCACRSLAAGMGFHVTGGPSGPGSGGRGAQHWARCRHTPVVRGGYPARRTSAARPVLMIADGTGHPAAEGAGAAGLRGGGHGAPVLWIVTRRPGDRGAGPVPAGPTAGAHTELVSLGPLPGPAASQLACDLLGVPPAASLGPLVRSASGHPRLVVELLRGMLEEGSVRIADGAAHLVRDELPARLRARVALTLEEYSGPCRQLLRVAAVLGRDLEWDVLAAVLRIPPPDLLPVLEEAYTTGMVGGDGTRTAFRHELARRVVAASVPASLRRALREEAARVRPAAPVAAEPPVGGGAQAGCAALNDRQSDVVALVRAGLTNRQIASELGMSPHTVNYHLRKLFTSFGVRSRIGLLRAVEEGRGAVPPVLSSGPCGRPGRAPLAALWGIDRPVPGPPGRPSPGYGPAHLEAAPDHPP